MSDSEKIQVASALADAVALLVSGGCPQEILRAYEQEHAQLITTILSASKTSERTIGFAPNGGKNAN